MSDFNSLNNFNDSWVFVNEYNDWSNKGQSCTMVNYPDLNNIEKGDRIMITGNSEEEIYAEYEKTHIIPYNESCVLERTNKKKS